MYVVQVSCSRRGFSSFLPKVGGGRWGGQVMTSLSWVMGARTSCHRLRSLGACTVRVGFIAGVSEIWLMRREMQGDSGTRPGAQMQRWGNHCWHALRVGRPHSAHSTMAQCTADPQTFCTCSPVTSEGRELFQKPERAVFLVKRAVQISLQSKPVFWCCKWLCPVVGMRGRC